MAVSFSGSLDISGSLTTTGTIVMSGSIASASFATNATTASNANTSSYVVSSQTDATQNTRLTTIEAVTGSYASTSSLSLTSASVAAINVRTGSYATTGSNYFIGTQVITGSVYIANDLIVQGSSSLQNITASAVSVGTNTIILNTATPILQFGGISVFDSGSTMGRSGSLLWNSINDHWINVNPSGSDEGYNSAMVINGPKNTGSLGQEVGLTTWYVPRSQGEDHLEDSNIYSSGSNVGIGTSTLTSTLDVNGNGRYAGIGLNATPISKGTSQNYIRFTNTGNDFYIGQEGSTAGAFFTGTNAYDNVLYGDKSYNFIIGGSSKLYISGSGNVGIGTNNPSTALHIQASVPTIRLTNSSAGAGAGSIQFYSGSTQIWNLGTHTNNDMYLYNNTTSTYNYWVQNSSGNIGIGGTTSPSSLLEINRSSNSGAGSTFPRINVVNSLATQGDGTSTYNFADLRLASGNGTVEMFLATTYAAGTWEPQGILNVGTNHPLSFKTNNTERMRILAGGNVGIGTTNPNAKLQVNGDVTLGGTLNSSWAVSVDNLGTTNANGLYVNIGASSTGVPFSVYKNFSSLFQIANTGAATFSSNVGIGGPSLGDILHIMRNGTSSYAAMRVTNTSSTADMYVGIGGSEVANTPLRNNAYIMNAAASGLAFGTSDAVRMTITSGGNVGIGTTAPTIPLQVNKAGTINSIMTQTVFSVADSNGWNLGSDGTNALIGVTNSGTDMVFLKRVTGVYSEAMRITSGGAVTINSSTSPNGKLYVNGANDTDVIAIQNTLNTGAFLVFADNVTPTWANAPRLGAINNDMIFRTVATERMRITSTGTVQPGANGTQDLGTSSLRWSTVYTSDLSLSNGIGDYTIVEGENDLFLYNNKQNKVYKFMLAEVDPADATPKKS